MIKAGIIGATGYAGVELYRLLQMHPGAKVVAVSSVSYTGQNMDAVYPNLYQIADDVLQDEDAVIAQSDVVFTAVPHGLSQDLAKKCQEKGVVMIDIGADFRLLDEADYQQWYGGTYTDLSLHEKSVYGLCELNREDIREADIIANPGCYPTSIALALFPALQADMIERTGIICDSKSGVTGAGRGMTQNTHFPECNEAFAAYKAGSHRHTPEIEQTLSQMADGEVKVTFVPHLLPVNRGILSTIYARLKGEATLDAVHEHYATFYQSEKFVRVLKKGEYAQLKNVKYSNYCDISVHVDERAHMLIVCSTIDNMVKGAAGQAIQNMNIRFGLEETAGLLFVPPAF